jgi:hypothetical protein
VPNHCNAAACAGVQLSFEWDARLPECQECDNLRISQILFNIVGNALKCARPPRAPPGHACTYGPVTFSTPARVFSHALGARSARVRCAEDIAWRTSCRRLRHHRQRPGKLTNIERAASNVNSKCFHLTGTAAGALQGPGISKERQARLFQPFEQADNDEFKRSSEGTGMRCAQMCACAWGQGKRRRLRM